LAGSGVVVHGVAVARWVAVAGGLDAAEDVCDLALELREVEVDDGAAWMQDDVDRRCEQRERGADGLAQAALDAVAIDGFAEGLGYREADARAGGLGSPVCRAQRVEVGELLCELLAAGLLDELVVGMFAQAVCGRRGDHEKRCREHRNVRWTQKHALDTETRSAGVLP
jgi:hypothetical protein